MKFKFTRKENGGGYLNKKKITPKKSLVIGITLGILVGGIGVGAATYFSASQVSYTPKDTSWNVSNVESAINDLYTTINNSDVTIKEILTATHGSSSKTGSYTVTKNGKAQIIYSINGTNNYTGGHRAAYFSITIYKNGTAIVTESKGVPNSYQFDYIASSKTIDVVEGDVIKVQVNYDTVNGLARAVLVM